jgi:hypothetical protein
MQIKAVNEFIRSYYLIAKTLLLLLLNILWRLQKQPCRLAKHSHQLRDLKRRD